MGMVTSCVFLIVMFLFIPFPFGQQLIKGHRHIFPHEEVISLINTRIILLNFFYSL